MEQTTGFEGVAARRLAPRYPADFPARLTSDAGSYVIGRLLDLSMHGAALAAPAALSGGERCRLDIADPHAGWRLSVAASIVATEPDPLGGYIHRVRFALNPEVAKQLARVVLELRRRFNRRQAAIATERLGPYSAPPGQPAA